ncbi:MAG: hypothetical protein ACRCUE_02055 [Bosea sp. (in: a-proteobacteria)]
MLASSDALQHGAHNLLLGCAEAKPGESLLILHEDPGLGYFGHGLAGAIAEAGKALGLNVRLREVPFDQRADTLSDELAADMARADHTLFLARLGDQLRFRQMPAGTRPIVSYVLDQPAMASQFGAAPHAAFVALKAAFNQVFARAGDIHVTCPLGTDFRGKVMADNAEPPDVGIKRFPVSVFAPIDAASFSGKVAVAHLLVGTGSKYYQPYGIPLGSTLFAHMSEGRIQRWEGPPEEVARAEEHYRHVADLFDIDAGFVHSWHAGIHPGCAFSEPAGANYERWSGSAFGNPRLLHFHTCGAYAPGEICWNVIDPTIRVDGVSVWEDGVIKIDEVPGAPDILAAYPAVRELFDSPALDIGLGVPRLRR